MRLKELRKSRGISQLKLAIDLNMNQNSISRYENGERDADYATLVRFADYFDVSVDYLLERTDNPKVNRMGHSEKRILIKSRGKRLPRLSFCGIIIRKECSGGYTE